MITVKVAYRFARERSRVAKNRDALLGASLAAAPEAFTVYRRKIRDVSEVPSAERLLEDSGLASRLWI